MLELSAALARILNTVPSLPGESIGLTAAVGRILAGPLVAPFDLPQFDNSAMDGYAVRAADVVGAHADDPVNLRVQGQLAAGESSQHALEPGSCMRVFTGSPLPPGADAVVMQEMTLPNPGQSDQVLILEGVQPCAHVRMQGEDVKRDSLVLSAGERLTPARLALAGSLGCKRLKVSRIPTVAVLSTGSELIDPGRAWKPGRIFESNRLVLHALLQSVPARPRLLPIIPDELTATREALEVALSSADVVITTGGASVGVLDLVRTAFTDIGGVLDFWKIAIRPGKPFFFGHFRDKLLFGLPGNPVSAMVTFLLLVRPALLRMQGARNCQLPSQPGTLTEPLRNPHDRRHFVRVRVTPNGEIQSAGKQGSHLLHSLAQADGLVEVPPHSTLLSGTTVTVLRWDR